MPRLGAELLLDPDELVVFRQPPTAATPEELPRFSERLLLASHAITGALATDQWRLSADATAVVIEKAYPAVNAGGNGHGRTPLPGMRS